MLSTVKHSVCSTTGVHQKALDSKIWAFRNLFRLGELSAATATSFRPLFGHRNISFYFISSWQKPQKTNLFELFLNLLKNPRKNKKIFPKRCFNKAKGLKNHLKQTQVLDATSCGSSSPPAFPCSPEPLARSPVASR